MQVGKLKRNEVNESKLRINKDKQGKWSFVVI